MEGGRAPKAAVETADAGDLRLEERVRTIARRLATGEVDVAEECDGFWTASRDGEHEYLFRLAQELELSGTLRESPLGLIGAIWSLVSEIEQAILAIPGEESVETLFRFAHLPLQNSLTHAPGMVDRRRYFASRLALNQPRPALFACMERHENNPQYRRLLFLLVQELVVQGHERKAPILERLGEQMRAAGHPLGWLPLRRLDLETTRADPRKTRTIHQYKVYDSRTTFPWGPASSRRMGSETGSETGSEDGSSPSGEAIPPRRRPKNWEITKGDDLLRIGAVVQNWQAESNGKWEARVFALHPPPRPDDLDADVFLHLHALDALDLPEGPRDFHLQKVDAEQAFAILFRAAANGGELNEGAFGAYGRLFAWQSLAGLVGAPDDASIEAVAHQAHETAFFFFAAQSSWLFGLGEEFALFALRADGRSLAVLAATDND